MRRSLASTVLLATLALWVAGTSFATPADHTIVVTDDPTERFDPQFLTIQVGDTVTWKNIAGTHNVTADDVSFTSGNPASAPWTYSFTFPAEGSISYHCALHQGDGQVGTIVVRPARASDEIAYSINAWDMERTAPSAVSESRADDFMRLAGELQSSVHLPSGAKITGIEISACDNSSTPNTTATLYICPEPDSPCSEVIRVTALNDTPTTVCRVWQSAGLADGPVVNNADNTYGLKVGAGLGFRSVKVYYRKVLSPSPATATFGDVPTNHQFFRVVEALAASGITQGCGGGNFCPEDPVTRSAMASFLARALGLSWPN